MSAGEIKFCTVCGRTITWRKKWERNWAEIRYCSKACRSRKRSAHDDALEAAILTLLRSRRGGASICPSEAARAVDESGWRALMEDARMAARRLVISGDVEITQRGRVVDPSTCRGPLRIRLAPRVG